MAEISFETYLCRSSADSVVVVAVIGALAGGGGRGGLQPPQSLGNSDFLGSKRKFGQSYF